MAGHSSQLFPHKKAMTETQGFIQRHCALLSLSKQIYKQEEKIMANKTIKQALEDLFIGLGGSSSALADNVDTSDVIDDLESAIKGCVGGVIDDTASSSTKTYSSSKIESLIPEAELPAVTADDNGKVLAVVEGAWTLCTMTAVADTTSGAVTFTFTPDSET
jgi:hypothetical protein